MSYNLQEKLIEVQKQKQQIANVKSLTKDVQNLIDDKPTKRKLAELDNFIKLKYKKIEVADSHRLQFTGKNILKSASTPQMISKKDPKELLKKYLNKENPDKIINYQTNQENRSLSNLKKERDTDLKVRLNENYNNTMKINKTSRTMDHNSQIGASKSLQEVIEDGQAMGVDRALRNKFPIEKITVDKLKTDIQKKLKNDKDQKENSIREERDNLIQYQEIARKKNYDSLIQFDKSKEENAQLNYLQQKLKRVKSDNALYNKNIERQELEKKLNNDDLAEKQKLIEKKNKQDQWIQKMSNIEKEKPFYQDKYEKIDAFADRHQSNNLVKAKIYAQEKVNKLSVDKQQVKLANEEQVHNHTIGQIHQSRKKLEERIRLDKQVEEELEQEKQRKQAKQLEQRDNSNFLKRQIGEQKRHNLVEQHKILSLNRSNNDIEEYQQGVYNKAKLSLIGRNN